MCSRFYIPPPPPPPQKKKSLEGALNSSSLAESDGPSCVSRVPDQAGISQLYNMRNPRCAQARFAQSSPSPLPFSLSPYPSSSLSPSKENKRRWDNHQETLPLFLRQPTTFASLSRLDFCLNPACFNLSWCRLRVGLR